MIPQILKKEKINEIYRENGNLFFDLIKDYVHFIMENRFIGNETRKLLVGIFNVMDFSKEYVEYKIKEQKKYLYSDELKEMYRPLLYFYDELLK